MRRRLLWSIFLLALILGAALAVHHYRRPGKLVRARVEPVIHAVYGLGTVVAERTFEVRPGVSSTLTGLWVQEGDIVRKGQPLIEFDGVITRAPLSGIVTSVPFKPGENVFSQQAVVSITDMRRLYLTVALEQRHIVQVRSGQPARVSLEALRSQPVLGRVRSIYPSSGQFMVRVEVPALPPGSLPGMTADIAIETGYAPRATVVPVKAIANGEVTVVLPGGKKRKLPVQTGAARGDWVEIVSGNVREGDLLQAG